MQLYVWPVRLGASNRLGSRHSNPGNRLSKFLRSHLRQDVDVCRDIQFNRSTPKEIAECFMSRVRAPDKGIEAGGADNSAEKNTLQLTSLCEIVRKQFDVPVAISA